MSTDPSEVQKMLETIAGNPELLAYARQILGAQSELSDIDLIRCMLRKEDPFVVDPFDKFMWQSDGIDLRLSNTFYVTKNKSQVRPIDTVAIADLEEEKIEAKYGEPIEITEGVAYRFITLQKVKVPRDFSAKLEPRTKNMRMSLEVSCGGSVDPGYSGPLSVIISNAGIHANRLYVWPLQRVVKLQLFPLSSLVMYDYQQRSGKYSDRNVSALPDTNDEIKLIQNGDFKTLSEMVLDAESLIAEYNRVNAGQR